MSFGWECTSDIWYRSGSVTFVYRSHAFHKQHRVFPQSYCVFVSFPGVIFLSYCGFGVFHIFTEHTGDRNGEAWWNRLVMYRLQTKGRGKFILFIIYWTYTNNTPHSYYLNGHLQHFLKKLVHVVCQGNLTFLDKNILLWNLYLLFIALSNLW